MKYLRPRLRPVALAMCLLLVFQIAFPVNAFALTDGPKSPEFSTFESVSTTDMVNPFSGDFTYNLPVLDVPGPDGGGYSLSLSYHSGVAIEQEASWVGFGWNLNPGSLNRDLRGFPDDYNKVEVKQYNKTRPNWTGSVAVSNGFSGTLEVFSLDLPTGINANQSYTLNNYQGTSRTSGLGLSSIGLSLNANIGENGLTFSGGINPVSMLMALKELGKKSDNNEDKKNKKRSYEFSKERVMADFNTRYANKATSNFSISSYGLFAHSEAMRATTYSPYRGSSYYFDFSAQANPSFFPIGVELGYSGNFNYQNNIAALPYQAYGYMHNPSIDDYPTNDQINGNRQHSGNILSDYYVEKSGPFQKRDYFLGVPFNNADNFIVTGEALTGGFRHYPSKLGHFYPNMGQSQSGTIFAGLELMAGANIGIGLTVGFGDQYFQSKRWDKTGNTGSVQFDSSERGLFRFNNDLGGKIEYAENTKKETGKLYREDPSLPPTGLLTNPNVDVPEGLSTNKSIRNSGRSSFIDYHTLGQLRTFDQSFRFNKNVNSTVTDWLIEAEELLQNDSSIVEFNITKEDGSQLVFGLPVFNANEANLQFSVDSMARIPCEARNNLQDCIQNNYLVYQDLPYDNFPFPDTSEHLSVLGEVKKEPYAGLYLLTQMTTPDYFDRNDNGPDKADFGGWTKFHYRQKYGLDDPYRWRIPYSGLLYMKNQISDTFDDLASVSTGDKEVYYLKAIETKTHIAFFVTNTSDKDAFLDVLPEDLQNADPVYFKPQKTFERYDGRSAPVFTGGGLDPAANRADEKGNKTLEYLDKIVLFSKARPEFPISTTRFEYDYSVAQNLPNNTYGNYPGNLGPNHHNSGKLTLNKVWFEYEGKFPTRISPYEFSYAYPDISNAIPTPYEELATELSEKFSTEQQYNPEYSPHLLNPWSAIEEDGQTRRKKLIPWPSQRIPDPATAFDPAAWQLKHIKLPSGGEIIVQYEEKDYRYVQDRPAMAMARLTGSDDNEQEFYLDVEYIGIAPTDRDALESFVALINDYYLPAHDSLKEKKIYFKFLYDFGDQVPAIDNCHSEYISGYAEFAGAELDAQNQVKIRLNGDDEKLPKKACVDFYLAYREGKDNFPIPNGTHPSYHCVTEKEKSHDNSITGAILNGESVFLPSLNLLRDMTDDPEVLATLYFSAFPGSIKDFAASLLTDHCQEINPELSFLKVPLPHPKRGGGIRVKRLLMYDEGIEREDAALYGTEYRYVSEDGKSSGVAVNEPSSMREENPLVSFLPRKGQRFFSRLTVGEDKKQTEGPLGESILPPASIGHSRVELHPIHRGKTNSGFQVQEYFTAKDFPFDKLYNAKENNDIAAGDQDPFTNLDRNKFDPFPIHLPAVLFNYKKSGTWMTQGFRFIQTQMHGQLKGNTTFGRSATGEPIISTSQSYTYYEPGEKVWLLQSDRTFRQDIPGKEEDITMEMKSLYNENKEISVEADVSIALTMLPIPFPPIVPSFTLDESQLNTHTTSKVIRYPAILKRVDTYQDGMYQFTENLAFSEHTGKTVLTRTTDEFHGTRIRGDIWDGSVYQLEVPASLVYDQMGQKAEDPRNTNQLQAVAGSFVTYGAAGNPLMDENGNEGAGSIDELRQVLSASVQTFDHQRSWFPTANATSEFGYLQERDIQGLTATWRPHASYVFKTDVQSSQNTPDAKIYDSGIMQDFQMFDWQDEASSANSDAGWLQMGEITKYSPNGQALEERDVLGIYHAIKYSPNYGFTVPSMRADNARYQSIAFKDFENQDLKDLELPTEPLLTGDFAHSGEYSRLIRRGDFQQILTNVHYTSEIRDGNGAWLKMWVKPKDIPEDPLILTAQINNRGYSPFPISMEKVAQTGAWSLYRGWLTNAAFHGAGLGLGSKVDLFFSTSEDIYIDDLRFQPYDAQAACFVYDNKTLRLIAQFDDQHFGLFYQYNDEGKLVRKMIETERGLRTVQETQYHIPKTDKK